MKKSKHTKTIGFIHMLRSVIMYKNSYFTMGVDIFNNSNNLQFFP